MIIWTDENAVVSYLIKGSQLLNGTGRQFNADRASALAKAEFRRANNFRSMYNHAQLQGAESYFGLTNLITQPCLIIHGTDDKIWNYRHASFLKNHLANSTLITLEGAGHELHEADWGKIIAAATQHIISIPLRS
ncbi:alpha/beta fold hydrolase [Dyadobacter sp. CY347]|uniref:alpha/beta fold hydrolase n=1 Tax=Dyadobacter sp. CY347 TaxID=2909336 RepID=UPI001F1D29C0|nr:alpha/beta hydrolase [Dyadobacter sp. CY347]MCF2489038.1 alpha/beta fold hydrolase [Dyadobacter sp. CY347]